MDTDSTEPIADPPACTADEPEAGPAVEEPAAPPTSLADAIFDFQIIQYPTVPRPAEKCRIGRDRHGKRSSR